MANVDQSYAEEELNRYAERVETSTKVCDGAGNDDVFGQGRTSGLSQLNLLRRMPGGMPPVRATSASNGLSDTKQERYHELSSVSIGRAIGGSACQGSAEMRASARRRADSSHASTVITNGRASLG